MVLTRSSPKRALLDRPLSRNTLAQVVTKRFGPDTCPDDLRTKFIVDLLNTTGGDASLVAEVVGMKVEAVLDYWSDENAS